MKEKEISLRNFKNCAENAPQGTYENVERLNKVIGDCVDNFMKEIRSIGLKANNDDLAFSLEISLYDYIKCSNPNSCLFALAEGFGEHIEGPDRDHILANTIRDRDIIASIIAYGC